MLRNKKLAVIASGAILALTLTACGTGGGATTPSSSAPPALDTGPQTLTVAIQAWMSNKLALQDMAAAYHTAHPNVTVNLVEYADNNALSTFSLQWSQGKADQDIVVVDGASTAVQFVPQGLIIDFNKTDMFTGDLTKDKFVGESLSYTELRGNQFAMPLGLEVYNISANKDILKQAGVIGADGKVPVFNTWDDVYAAAEKVYKATGQPGMTIQWGPNAMATMISVEQAVRGNLYKADGKTLTFDTPEMRKVFEVWRKGVESGIFSIDTFASKDAGRSNFNAGTLAMLLESASRVAEAGQAIGADKVTVLAMPGSLTNGSYGFSAGVLVPTASKNQALALDFIKTTVMGDLQVKAGVEWGKLPVISRYFDQIQADWKDQMYSVIEKSVPAPMYNDLAVISDRGKQMLQEYLTGKVTLDQFITNLEGMIGSSDLGS